MGSRYLSRPLGTNNAWNLKFLQLDRRHCQAGPPKKCSSSQAPSPMRIIFQNSGVQLHQSRNATFCTHCAYRSVTVQETRKTYHWHVYFPYYTRQTDWEGNILTCLIMLWCTCLHHDQTNGDRSLLAGEISKQHCWFTNGRDRRNTKIELLQVSALPERMSILWIDAWRLSVSVAK